MSDDIAGANRSSRSGARAASSRISRRIGRPLRYLAAGGASAAADVSVLVLLREIADAPLPAAVLGGYAAGVALNYALVSRLGFGTSAHGPALARYAGLLLLNVAVTVVAVNAGSAAGAPYVVVKTVVLVVLSIINYKAYASFVFRNAARGAGRPVRDTFA